MQGASGWSITGTTEPGAQVTVTRDSDGKVVGGINYANTSGYYGVYLNSDVTVQPGETFHVTAEAPGKTVSLAATVAASANQLPVTDTPKVVGDIYSSGALLNVRTASNAFVRVIYKGNIIAGTVSDVAGNATIPIYMFDGWVGEAVSIISTEFGKQDSAPVIKHIMPPTEQSMKPDCGTCILYEHSNNGLPVSIQPYDTLVVTDDYGAVLMRLPTFVSVTAPVGPGSIVNVPSTAIVPDEGP
jgi:hypothetical protein